MTARLSMRDAINAMCKQCIYDPLSRGTWREQVAGCSSSGCPLHPLRPGPINAKKPGSGEAEDPTQGDRSDCAATAEDLTLEEQSSA